MKRFTLMACAGLMAAAMATPSLAADLPRPAYKAPVSLVAPHSVGPASTSASTAATAGDIATGATLSAPTPVSL